MVMVLLPGPKSLRQAGVLPLRIVQPGLLVGSLI